MHNTSSEEILRATIIVPAYNAETSLGACLTALMTQRVAPTTTYEIIVIDDNSADNTKQVAESFQGQAIDIHIISKGKLGKSGTRNAGIKAARGEIILFTDSDCEPTPNWIESMLLPFNDPEVVGLKGAYLTKQSSLIPRFIQVEHEERYVRMASQPAIDFIDTYSAGYRRSTLLEYGGFDEQLTNSMVEDQELSFRLAGDGKKMVFVPGARVYHQHLSQVGRYFWRKFAIASWKALIVKRHPARLVEDSRTPQMIKVQMVLALLMTPLMPLALLWRPARLWLAGLLSAFGLSCLPFLQLAAERDEETQKIAIPMLLVRAFALAYGYIHGTIKWRGAAGQQFVGNAPDELKSVSLNGAAASTSTNAGPTEIQKTN